MVLDDNGLLQTDATILAGLLILLTLLTFKEAKISLPEKPAFVFPSKMSDEEIVEKEKEIDKKFSDTIKQFWETTVASQNRIRNTLSFLTLGIVPFSLSGIFIVLDFGTCWDLAARYVMVAGFAYLIIGVVFIVTAYRNVTEVPPQKKR
jgi:hypothetical protein